MTNSPQRLTGVPRAAMLSTRQPADARARLRDTSSPTDEDSHMGEDPITDDPITDDPELQYVVDAWDDLNDRERAILTAVAKKRRDVRQAG